MSEQTGAPADVAPWRGRHALYVLGFGLVAYGLRGIAFDVNGWTDPGYWAALLVVAAVAHDLVLVPLVFLVAVPVTRLLPLALQRYAAAGLALSGVLVALAWSGLRSDGRLPDNPSVLPLDYASGLRTALTVLWLALLLGLAGQALRARSRGSSRERDPAARRPG